MANLKQQLSQMSIVETLGMFIDLLTGLTFENQYVLHRLVPSRRFGFWTGEKRTRWDFEVTHVWWLMMI